MKVNGIQTTNKERHARYYQEHKDRLKAYRNEWARSHPDNVKAYYSSPEAKAARRRIKREWDRKRAADPIFRLSNNVRTTMSHALKGKKGFRKWETLTGYTLEDLIKHLSPQLKNGMTWENYGETWHVDHITPKSWNPCTWSYFLGYNLILITIFILMMRFQDVRIAGARI